MILIIAFISFILYQTKDEINADLENIEQKINSFYNKNEMAGFAVSVFNSDSIIYSQGFGFADVDQKVPYTTETLQYIASISKTTIGVSLLKAQELGLLSLEDPINLHLPFKIYNPNFPDSEITIQQLATHTSSMVYNEQFVESLYINDNKKDASLKQILEDYFVNGQYGKVSFSDHLPGTVWDYSNTGAGLAAYIIEYKSGMTYEDFTQKYIFDPLKMDNTYWFESKADSSIFSKYYEPIDDKSIVEVKTSGVKLYPARDMITNVKDLTKFGQAILSMNPDLLSAQSYKNMLGR